MVSAVGLDRPGPARRERSGKARRVTSWASGPLAARLDEIGVPDKLADERMGHANGSVQARYSHVTQPMRDQLMIGLTEMWCAALDARLAMSPRSPVAVLDQLLAARAATAT